MKNSEKHTLKVENIANWSQGAFWTDTIKVVLFCSMIYFNIWWFLSLYWTGEYPPKVSFILSLLYQ